MGNFVDISGRTYGYLNVIKRAENKGRNSAFICMCKCGKKTVVAARHLKSGETVSCGCYRQEVSTKHGDSHSRLYRIYKHMQQRCSNPSDAAYKEYGARGIKVNSEWNDYVKFKKWALENGYSAHLTIDRIDFNLGYSSDNCRWVDRLVQAANRRVNSKNTSGYTGVCAFQGKWQSGITYKGVRVHLGVYGSAEAAARARDEYIIANGYEHPLSGVA